MSLFSDDFSSYPIGNSACPPWDQLGLGGTVQNVGYRGQGFAFNSSGGLRRNTEAVYTSDFTVYYYFKFPNAPYNHTILEILNGIPTPGPTDPPPIMLFRLGFEDDGTLTAITAGALLGNSGTELGYSLYSDKWYFVQVNVKLDVDVGGFVTCNASVTLDGITVIDSLIAIASTQLQSGLSNGTASVNKFDFRDLSTQSIIDEILVNTPRDTVPTYPNPGVTVKGRDTQLIIEHADLIDSGDARVTQLIVEYGELIDDQKVRVTQLIIEVAAENISSQGGWKVREI